MKNKTRNLTSRFLKCSILVFSVILMNPGVTQENSESKKPKTKTSINFDKVKWRIKKGNGYPYREEILDTILHSDLVRKLNKVEINELLGEPSYYRDDKSYLYYLISKKSFLRIWTLHTKTLVIKLNQNDTVEWIKIHK